METYLLDTNVLVLKTIFLLKKRITIKEKELYKFVRKLPPESMCIPDFIVHEYEVVMSRVIPSRYDYDKRTNKVVRDVFFMVMDRLVKKANLLESKVDDLKLAYKWYREEGGKYMSLADFNLIVLAKRTQFPLITLDKLLLRAAKKENVKIFTVKA